MIIGIFIVSAFKKGLDSMIVWKSAHPKLLSSTKFLKVKMNRNQTSNSLNSQCKRSAKST